MFNWEQSAEDEEHKTVPGRLLKWFTKLRDYFISNPVNALTRCQFHPHFTHAFLYQSVLRSFFANYSLAL